LELVESLLHAEMSIYTTLHRFSVKTSFTNLVLS